MDEGPSSGKSPERRFDQPDATIVVAHLLEFLVLEMQEVPFEAQDERIVVGLLKSLRRFEKEVDKLTPDPAALRKSAVNHLLTLERLVYAIRLLLEAERLDLIAEIKTSLRAVVSTYDERADPTVADAAPMLLTAAAEWKRLEGVLRDSQDPKVILATQILRGLTLTDLARFVRESPPPKLGGALKRPSLPKPRPPTAKEAPGNE